jgi:hypothetical protein
MRRQPGQPGFPGQSGLPGQSGDSDDESPRQTSRTTTTPRSSQGWFDRNSNTAVETPRSRGAALQANLMENGESSLLSRSQSRAPRTGGFFSSVFGSQPGCTVAGICDFAAEYTTANARAAGFEVMRMSRDEAKFLARHDVTSNWANQDQIGLTWGSDAERVQTPHHTLAPVARNTSQKRPFTPNVPAW